MEFNSLQLSDVCSYRREKIKPINISENDYISTDNMLADKKGIKGLSNLPEKGNVNIYKSEDTLISNIRPYFKKIWFSDKNGGCSADVLVFEAKKEYILSKYLYYFLSQNEFFDYMVQTSKGTKMPRGDKDAIMKYEIKVPPKSYQKKVVELLSNIDEKITTNEKIVSNLEQLSQTFFKHWFIDFEFPNEQGQPYKSSGGEIVESELGEIPKGWNIEKLSNVCEVKDGTHDSPKQVENGHPLVTSKHLKNHEIDFSTTKLISEEDFIKVNKRSLVETQDILISMIGTVGRLYFVQEENINYAIKNIGLIKSSQTDIAEYIYMYFKSPFMINHIKERMTGSTQQYISLTELRKIPVVLPKENILSRYLELIKPKFDMIFSLIQENQKLSKFRDTLLQKLLLGEIEIPDDLEVK